jgi:hypothetical protein
MGFHRWKGWPARWRRCFPILEIDSASGHFTGPTAEAANQFLKREYRDGYVVPEIG